MILPLPEQGLRLGQGAVELPASKRARASFGKTPPPSRGLPGGEAHKAIQDFFNKLQAIENLGGLQIDG